MSRAILLTGATGFVGGHLARALVDAGHRVRCTLRASSDTRWIDGLDVERVELDLSSAEGVVGAMSGVDRVVHVAGLTRAPSERAFLEVNAEGTDRLAHAAAEAEVRRFVLISSLAARGPDGAVGPVSPYGRSKRAGEDRLAALDAGFDRVTLRLGGVYGPHDTDLLPLFQMARRGFLIMPRGAPELQPVYVEDAVGATLAALDGAVPSDPLPIAHPQVHTWGEVAEGLSAALGRPVRKLAVPAGVFWTAGLGSELAARVTGRAPAMDRRRARDLSHYSWTCDPRPAMRALDWRPEVALGEGLRRTAAWYREVGWL